MLYRQTFLIDLFAERRHTTSDPRFRSVRDGIERFPHFSFSSNSVSKSSALAARLSKKLLHGLRKRRLNCVPRKKATCNPSRVTGVSGCRNRLPNSFEHEPLIRFRNYEQLHCKSDATTERSNWANPTSKPWYHLDSRPKPATDWCLHDVLASVEWAGAAIFDSGNLNGNILRKTN